MVAVCLIAILSFLFIYISTYMLVQKKDSAGFLFLFLLLGFGVRSGRSRG